MYLFLSLKPLFPNLQTFLKLHKIIIQKNETKIKNTVEFVKKMLSNTFFTHFCLFNFTISTNFAIAIIYV